MDSYLQYPIRCKTCNHQIACFAESYQALLNSQMTAEEALTAVGLTQYCCRIAMMNPTTIHFNMEDRQVIEGLKSVDNVDLPSDLQSRAAPVFPNCLTDEVCGRAIPKPTVVSTAASSANQPAIGQTISVPQPSIRQVGEMKPVSGASRLGPLNKLTAQPAGELTTVDFISSVRPTSEGIPVDVPTADQFVEPTQPGIPTINTDASLGSRLIYVGAGKETRLLGGCTYLAR